MIKEINLKYIELIKNDYKIFLQFLKAKYPIFHNSNFFPRELQFGAAKYMQNKGIKISYGQAEGLAKAVGSFLEQEGIFVRVNNHGWRINYKEFVTKVPGDPL
jgi:hypothetical protein